MKNNLLKSLLLAIAMLMGLSVNAQSSESEDIKVQNLTYIPGTSDLTIGESVQIGIIIFPSDATNQTLSWSSSDESVANVANGKVTAIGLGTAKITATTTDGSNLSITITISVIDADIISNGINYNINCLGGFLCPPEFFFV